MRPLWRGAGVLLVLGMLLAATTAAAAPNEDGQPAGAPSRHDPAWRGWMTANAADRVYDIAQIGNTVYVAGTFTGVRPTLGGTVTAQANLVAFDAATGALRTGFRPVVNGTVQALQPSADGTQLYLGGTFTALNGVAKARLAAVDPRTGATVGNLPNVGGGSVRTMLLRGTTLYLGGNLATVRGLTRSRLAAVNVTNGGVVAGWQPVADDTVLTLEGSPDGSRIYVGGRFTTLNGSAGGGHLAAVDPVTGRQLPSFGAQPGREVFDVLADERGLVWVGLGGVLGRLDVYREDGRLVTRHQSAGDVQVVEQVGGLIYAGGHDMGPSETEILGIIDPAAPAILDTWSFPEPATGGDGLWAIHSTGTDLWLGGSPTGPWTGFTRHAAVADPPARTELVSVLSTWRYLDSAAAPAGWRSPGFDDSAWRWGAAELGFGDSGEQTVLTPGRVTYYFRRTFSVTDVASLTDRRLEVLADDGAVVYVNGTEVARTNLSAGTVTDTTSAPVSLFGNAEDTFQTFTVPAGVLVEGTNTIAVEVHQAGASSSDLSFDARLSAVIVDDRAPPSVPTGLAVANVTRTGADLSWQPAADDVGVTGYEVLVGGQVVGTTAIPVYRVSLPAATTTSVAVRAVDGVGNRSSASAPLSVTTPYGPVALVPLGSTWRYRDAASAPPADWNQPAFADGSWPSGAAVLGRGRGDEVTALAKGYDTGWFRRSFTVTGAAGVAGLRVDLVADDGAVVYLNGVELVRDNLPTGPLAWNTPTPTYRTGASELTVRSFAVPRAALLDGANVLAVAVHQGSGSPDLRFDLRLVAL